MGEIDKIILLNKYLNNYDKYDKYFNTIYNIGIHIYNNLYYDNLTVTGSSIFYILYKKHNICAKYFKYFKTTAIDLVSRYKNLNSLHNVIYKNTFKVHALNDLSKILDNNTIKDNIEVINKLLQNKFKYNIKLEIQYYNGSCIKIQLLYSNYELTFSIVNIYINISPIIPTMIYEYKNNYFIGENILINTLLYVSPFNKVWNVVEDNYLYDQQKTKYHLFTMAAKITSENAILYDTYIRNFIKGKLMFDIFKYNHEILHNYSCIDSKSIKCHLLELKTSFYSYIIPDIYINAINFNKIEIYRYIDYIEAIIDITLYLDKEMVNHQQVNNNYSISLDIPKISYEKYNHVYDKKKTLPLLNIHNYKKLERTRYINDATIIQDCNNLCENKLKYLYTYLN